MTPGIHLGIPPEVYHSHEGSVSHSMMMKLFGVGRTPAKFKAGWRGEATASKSFGSLVHALLFGEEHLFTVSPFDSFRTNAAKEWRDEQAANGVTVVGADDMDTARAMVAEVRKHPVAGPLLSSGEPEVSLFWEDEQTGLTRRARIDWLPTRVPGQPFIVPDYKTTDAADEVSFGKSAGKYGYHRQQAWYEDGIKAVGLDDEPVFVFIAQEKTKPYLVNVVQLDPVDVAIGRELNSMALRLYAECLECDEWPGYATNITTVSLPAYERFAAEDLLGYNDEIEVA